MIRIEIFPTERGIYCCAHYRNFSPYFSKACFPLPLNGIRIGIWSNEVPAGRTCNLPVWPNKSRVLPGTSNNGNPFMVSFPYHSHIFRDSYRCGMGIVHKGSHFGVSLKIPLNKASFLSFVFPVEEVVCMKTCDEHPPWLMYSDCFTLKEKYGRRFLKVIWKNCSPES